MLQIDDEELNVLLAVPATALDAVLGRPAPQSYAVRRADGRTAHHALTTAIDRIRRETDGHPASGAPFTEDVSRLRKLLEPLAPPYPPLQSASCEMTDADCRAAWTALLVPWSAVEINVAPVAGHPGRDCGLLAAPSGGTAWTIADMTSAVGMARIRGTARRGRHVYWRPADGAGHALLVDDVTTEDQPDLPAWLRWVRPHAVLQTSRWKTQVIFRMPTDVQDADALAAYLNALHGDPNVRSARHWRRLPGVWNWKQPAEPWCCRILSLGTDADVAWANAWLVHMDKERRKQKQPAPPSPLRRQRTSQTTPPAQDTPVLGTVLPPTPPELVQEGMRNTEATKTAGRHLARYWGDVTGMWSALQEWNARLPAPLTSAELTVIGRSIIREDQQNHPERWRRAATAMPAAERHAAPRTATTNPNPKPKSPSPSPVDIELDALAADALRTYRKRGIWPHLPDDALLSALRSAIASTPPAERSSRWSPDAIIDPANRKR